MQKSRLIIPVFLFLLVACEKVNIPNGYPTTYSKINNLSQKQANYISRNPYIESSLNDFGFCDIIGDLLNRSTPPSIGDVSESEATAGVSDFVSNNASETGIYDPQLLAFRSKTKQISYSGSVLWHFRSLNQKIDTIEVLFTDMLFHLENGKMTSCYGNWYPEIYIPSEFNFYQSKAKNVLIGKVVSHYSIGGEEYKFTISKNNLDNCSFHLKILPKKIDDIIELHVCWEIYVPDVDYILYVDVMSGDIVGQEPTIIS
jgi:hypothetical protein